MNGSHFTSASQSVDLSRVLLVDNNGEFRDQLAERLIADGFHVTSCTAQDAVAELAQTRYTAAILELELAQLPVPQLVTELVQVAHRADWYTELIGRTSGVESSVPAPLRRALAAVLPAAAGIDAMVAKVHLAARRRMTQVLIETENRYRWLMEGANDAILVADAKSGRIVDANRKARQLIGHSLPELQKMQQCDIHPPEELDLFRNILRQQLGHRRGLVSELQVVHRSGRRFAVEMSCTELVSAGRSLIQSVLRNVTDRKRSEQALRMSDERFRQLTENIDEVFWLIDWTTLTAIYVSPAYEAIWGRTCESAVASPEGPISHIHEQDLQRVREAFRWEAPQGSFDEEFRIVRPDGQIRWIRQRAFPIFNVAGELYRIAAVANDVTDRRLVQDELQKRNRELAHLSRLSAMGQLVAELAHEINQPLYAISNYADACINVLRTKPPDEDELLIQWTQQIAVQAKRAGAIIRRVARFVRRDVTNESRVNLNDLIHGTLELLELEFTARQVSVQLELSDDLPEVVVTPLHIEQVLMNLLRNAMDAMRERTGSERGITIQTRMADDRNLEVSIGDTGEGIDATIREHLFEPFFTTKRDGIGLGLAICQSTVDSYGGTIQADSEPGSGATFRFTLPVGTC